ncbi:MAG: peroxiredoxin-like family protein [Alphaproteobacteria bacterium]
MSKPLKPNPAFEKARADHDSLGEQLADYHAALDKRVPDVGAAYQSLIEKLQRLGTGSMAPKVGDTLPSFLMPNLEGRLVSSRDLLDKGPLVISFNRGHWCPFCWLELAALGDINAAVEKQGSSIVSITPETATWNRELKQRLHLSYDILSDIDNGYSLELGLTMPVSEEIRTLLEPRGIDLSIFQNNKSSFLPLPAIFIVDQGSVIRQSYVNPDYRQRFDPVQIPDILSAID